MTTSSVAVFEGCRHKASLKRKIAQAIAALAPASVRQEVVEIGDPPIYNRDLDDDATPPAVWTAFRDKVRGFDAVLFVRPEYNRSVPAVLKNSLDVGSRPYGKNVWNGKPGAMVSVSPDALSGFGANHHLRQSLVFLNVPTLQQPEAYVGRAGALFDNTGALMNERTLEFLADFSRRFAAWIDNNRGL